MCAEHAPDAIDAVGKEAHPFRQRREGDAEPGVLVGVTAESIVGGARIDEGDRVNFDMEDSAKGPQAVNVTKA